MPRTLWIPTALNFLGVFAPQHEWDETYACMHEQAHEPTTILAEALPMIAPPSPDYIGEVLVDASTQTPHGQIQKDNDTNTNTWTKTRKKLIRTLRHNIVHWMQKYKDAQLKIKDLTEKLAGLTMKRGASARYFSEKGGLMVALKEILIQNMGICKVIDTL